MKIFPLVGAFVAAFMSCALSGAEPSDARLLAGWKVEQSDRLGDMFYFYPDGVFVRQSPRRREFVTTGRWRLEDSSTLVMFEQFPRNTTLKAEELETIRKEEEIVSFVFTSDLTMKWTEKGGGTRSLRRFRDLPDRTENPYWGLGTDESYERGARRAPGLRTDEEKSEANKRVEATSGTRAEN
jgi:hypothetical protein